MRCDIRSVVVWSCLMASAGAGLAAAQIELDRIVSRVGGRIITQSDIRQARALKLVEDTSSDAAIRRELENRLLILAEMNRTAGASLASDADLASGRRRWESTFTPSVNPRQLLSQTGMAEADLDNWLRDDVRIRAYITRQFASMPEAERATATEAWITRLRQRAGLE